MGSGEISDKLRVTDAGGINVKPSERRQNASRLSKFLGGINVHFTCFAPHGIIYDAIEWFCQRVGIKTHAQEVYVQNISNQIQAVGLDGTLLSWCHSRGGETTDNLKYYLSHEECMTMKVRSFGSAKQISSSDFGEAYNYVSKRDGIPFICDPIGCIKGFCKMDPNIKIEFLNSKGIPGFDHFWNGKTYQDIMEQLGQVFQDTMKQ